MLIVAERKRDRGSSASEQASAVPKTSNDASEESDDETDESSDVKAKITTRKALLESVEKAQLKAVNTSEKLDRYTKLRELVEGSVDIEF